MKNRIIRLLIVFSLFVFSGSTELRSQENSVNIEIAAPETGETLWDTFNSGMYSWTRNDFAQAMPAIRMSELALDVSVTDNYPWLSRNQSTRPLWYAKERAFFFSKRSMRFYENTLRTKHRYLCDGLDCQELAWKMMQRSSNIGLRHMAFARKLQDNASINDTGYMRHLSSLKQVSSGLAEDLRNGVPLDNRLVNRYLDQREALLSRFWKQSPSLRVWDPIYTPTIADVQSVLRPDEYIMSYSYVMRCRRPILFVIGHKSLSFGRVGSADRNCSTWYFEFAILALQHELSKPPDPSSAAIATDWLATNLYDDRFMPPPGSSLYIVPDETLSAAPFEWLNYDGRALREQYEVRYLPSASFLYSVRSSGQPDRKPIQSFVGLGRGSHSDLGDIDTDVYLGSLRVHFPDSVLATDLREADWPQFRTQIEDAEHIALFTHTSETKPDFSFSTDAGEPLVRFRPDEGASVQGLAFGRGDGKDGIVTGAELFAGTQLKARSVLILACDGNGNRFIRTTSEAYSSLTYAALAAGAENVIVTRWPVKAEVAGDFLDLYSENLASGLSPYQSYKDALNKLYTSADSQRYAWVFVAGGHRGE